MIAIIIFIIYIGNTIIYISKFINFFSFYFIYLMICFCFFCSILEVFSYVHSWRTDNNFTFFIKSLWYSVICQLCEYYLLLAFLFCLVLTLFSIANWDSVSNVWCQQYQHFAILLTAPKVWDRSCCLWKASLIVSV